MRQHFAGNEEPPEGNSAVIDGTELIAVALWTGALRAKGTDTVVDVERFATFRELPRQVQDQFLDEALRLLENAIEEAHACQRDPGPGGKVVLS